MEQVDEKTLVRRLFEEAINGNDRGVAEELLSSNHTFVDGFHSILGLGADGFHSLTYDREIRVRDLKFELLEMVAEPGRVTAVWDASGTAGSGSMVHVRGMSLHRFKDKKITRSELSFNPFGWLPKL